MKKISSCSPTENINGQWRCELCWSSGLKSFGDILFFYHYWNLLKPRIQGDHSYCNLQALSGVLVYIADLPPFRLPCWQRSCPPLCWGSRVFSVLPTWLPECETNIRSKASCQSATASASLCCFFHGLLSMQSNPVQVAPHLDTCPQLLLQDCSSVWNCSRG